MKAPIQRLTALAVALLATAALAYVLPAYSILRRATDQRDELQVLTWKIEGALSLQGDAAKDAASALKLTLEGTELQADGVVSLKLPGRCRFEASSPVGGTAAAISSGGKARTDGGAIPALQAAVEQLCAILATRSGQEGESRAQWERHLSKHGVDVKRSSLSRFAGQVVYLIGDPAEGQPQFALFKETFLPARVRFGDAAARWDVRFLDFNSPATGEAFPRVVEVWKADKLQLRFTVLTAEPKAQLANELF